MIRNAILLLVTMFLTFLCTATAFAATGDGESLMELAKPIFDALKGGQWLLAGAGGLIFAVAAMRKYGAKRWPYWGSDEGGTMLTLIGAFGATLATAFATGAGLSLSLLWMAVLAACAAGGGYTMVKRLLMPHLEKLAARYPRFAWLIKPLVWLFSSPAVKEAEKAGQAAVEASPGGGAASITGAAKVID